MSEDAGVSAECAWFTPSFTLTGIGSPEMRLEGAKMGGFIEKYRLPSIPRCSKLSALLLIGLK